MIDENYDYENSVNLIYTNDSHRGPGKVVQNLIKGLKEIDVSVHDKFDSRAWKYTGYLQYCDQDRGFLNQCIENKRPILLGPNLFVLPTDNPYLCQNFNDFVVPCHWVKELYQSFKLMKNKNMHVWAVGIDTEEWKHSPEKEIQSDLDCFIYFKNRTENDLAVAEAICKKNNLKYEVLKYGNYHESHLKTLCSKVKTNNGFVILLTGTESQGIAYQNILSYNLPCYVLNCPFWKSDDGRVTVEATSIPYFNEKCGTISNNVNLEHFRNFMDDVKANNFNPRKYIVENLSLARQAKEYMKFLKIGYEDLT